MIRKMCLLIQYGARLTHDKVGAGIDVWDLDGDRACSSVEVLSKPGNVVGGAIRGGVVEISPGNVVCVRRSI